MSIRYASRGSHTFYGGYHFGPVLGFFGLVQNPRTDYREALLGVGTSVGLENGTGVLIGTAAAYASDGWYAQLYLLPSLTVGRFELSGTLEYYQPLERRQARQFYTTPVNAFWLVRRGVALGAAYLLSVQQGAPTAQSLGPSLRLGVPRGSLRFDLMRTVALAPDEVRVTLTTSF